MAAHDWIKSTLGHGESMCRKCKITNREAAVLGQLNTCDVEEPPMTPPPADIAGLVERLRSDFAKLAFDARLDNLSLTDIAKRSTAIASDALLALSSPPVPVDFGHDEPCYYCGEPCDALAGNPTRWPLGFPHQDDPGVVKYQHVGCVLERLPENAPPALVGWPKRPMAFLVHGQVVTREEAAQDISDQTGEPYHGLYLRSSVEPPPAPVGSKVDGLVANLRASLPKQEAAPTTSTSPEQET